MSNSSVRFHSFLRTGLAIFVVLGLLLHQPVTPALALGAPVPTVTLNVPAEGLIGESFNFTATFDNTGALTDDTGYGPYIDLILPATGADGAGAATDDGITITGATYLGIALTVQVVTFDALGHASHPYAVDNTGAPIIVNGTPGDQLVAIELPFGSFTRDQPPAVVTVSAALSNLADVNTPLTISANGGFRFGGDALNNPATDPSDIGASVNANITPTLLRLTKTYVGPENETATGPNFPRQYQVNVDIAAGQTITELQITDVLPNNLQFVQVDATTVNGGSVATTAIATPSTTTPGGTLTRQFASVTGTTAADDAALLFTFYVPYTNSAAALVLPADTGDDRTSVDDARAQGNWEPIDTRDTAALVTSNATTNDHTLQDKSIAIQKSVANVTDASNSPGDVLEYTLDFQISDYFAFNGVVISDTFSDGQNFLAGYIPTLQVNGNTYTLASAAMNAANYTVDVSQIANDTNPATDGSTTVYFRVSNEIITRGQNGRLIGGCVASGGSAADCAAQNDGATTGRITFRTVIQDRFTDTYPSGDYSVDHGDVLSNTVLVDGLILNNLTLARNGYAEADGSAAQLRIVQGQVYKSIYARNGVLCPASPTEPACANGAPTTPGGTITYRIRYTLPNSDFEALTLQDYLPLPIFSVVDPNATGATSHTWTYDGGAGVLPASGTWKRLATDSLFPIAGITPAVSVDAAANSLTFSFGNFDDPLNRATQVDLLFTITASATPFADGLYLTNQVRGSEGSTNGGSSIADTIIQVELTEPVLNIRKGVVATDGPQGIYAPSTNLPAGVTITPPGTLACPRLGGSLPVTTSTLPTRFNSDLSNVDAGDHVTFAIVVQNSGSGLNGAFDVRLRDTIPAGFAVPSTGINLCVTDGTGAAMAYTNIGSGLFDAAGGIELTDPGPTATPTGALDPGIDAYTNLTINNGRNIAIVTYDLVLQSTVQPNAQLVNTATLYNYAGIEGGADHTNPNDLSDPATVTIRAGDLTKNFINTNQAHTTGADVVIGEILTYTVGLNVVEGDAYNLVMTDTLPAGLAFVDQVSFANSHPASVTLTGSTTPVIGANGQTVTWNLGHVNNIDTNNAITETLTFTYRAVVLNVLSNQQGTALQNSVRMTTTNGPAVTVQAPAVNVVEPSMTVIIDASTNTADAGDVITFTVDIFNTGIFDAFNVRLEDLIPLADMTYVPGSLANVSGPAGVLNDSANPLAATWATFGVGQHSVLTFRVTLNTSVSPAQPPLSVTADLRWTSLPGDVSTPQSAYNTASVERTGADGYVGLNDYFASQSDPVRVFTPVPVKAVVSSSEAHTTGSQLTIGEVVRYRLTARLPEGSIPGLELVDALPDGLAYVNDGQTMVAFVASTPLNITSSTLSGAGLQFAGDETTITGTVPTFVLPGAAISGGAGNGDDVTFSLGNVINAESDSSYEYVIVEFNALVTNVATNQAYNNATGAATPTTLTNVFSVRVDTYVLVSNSVDVTIVEPLVNLAKTILTPASPPDAGGVVTYRATLSHPGGANTSTAFNVIFTDTLPSGLGSLTLIGATPAGGAAGVSTSVVGSTLVVTAASIPAGGSVTIDFSAAIETSVTAYQVITNTGLVTYTSLPGASAVERDGTDGPGGALDDYATTASAAFNIDNVSIRKAIINTSATQTIDPNVAIGEVITYSLVITLPEGTLSSLRITDTIPVGMSYITGTVALDTTGYNGTLPAPTVTSAWGSGNDIVLAFAGPINVPADGITTNSRFTITFRAVVLTVPDQTVLPNTAIVQVGGGVPAMSNTVTVIVITTPGAVGDRIWLDENSDGVQDAGEAGIPNVSVTITGTDIFGNAVNITTVTDTEGNYIFPNLQPGSYTVTVNPATLPTGLATNPTYDENGIGTPNVSTVTLNLGQEYVTADFGYNWAASGDVTTNTGTGAIGDRLWIDADGDGQQDPNEAGLPGVSVALITPGADGVFGTSDDVTATTTTTNATGNYIFDGLVAGSYVVRVNGGVVPTGYTQTGDPDAWGALCTTCDNRTTTPILLAPGDVYVNTDFGYRPTGSSNTIGNTIFFDSNGDGLGAGELGIPGVSVALLDGSGNVIATTVTNANGQYSFPGLPDGTYTVWVNDTANVLGGQVQTSTPSSSVENGQPCGTCTGRNTVTVSVASGAGNTFQDFGYAPNSHSTGDGLIGDTIFLDRDGSLSYNPGEGLEGVRVNLFSDTNGDGNYDAGEPIIAATLTDENGHYAFGNLPAGNYVVQVDTTTLPAGLTNTVDAGDGVLNEGGVTLAAGGVNLNQDFGYAAATPNTISGTIWRDTNADGTLTEAGRFAGITVALYDTNGNIVATTTTDVNGNYTFANLPDGTYRVDVTDSANLLNGYWHSTGATPGADNNSQSDTYTVTVTGGQANSTADFGYFRDPAGVGNFVWLDLNNDGVQDSGEPGIKGITVTLTITYPNGTVTNLAVRSQALGAYNFGNLLLDENNTAIASYSIKISTPPGATPSPTFVVTATTATDSNGINMALASPARGQTDETYDSGFFTTRIDLGDLPDTYRTLFRPGPANLVITQTINGIPGVWLGLLVDAETNGQPDVNARGDDNNGQDDEDGLTLVPGGWITGSNATMNVTVNSSGNSVRVYYAVWIDWNQDSVFDTFYTSSGLSGSPRSYPVTVSVPTTYVPNSSVYFRVRASDQPLTQADYEGTLANGETEDYVTTFTPTAVEVADLRAAAALPTVWMLAAAALLLLSSLGSVTALAYARSKANGQG
jgi:uncharacterized repeat protein (TIGR01451 family)/fimbrial isopeptide formation D2 family protein